jgi:hypothetical protein
MGLIKQGSTAVSNISNYKESVEVKETIQNTEDTRDTKTKQIQAQGIIQAALQSPVLQLFATDFNNYMELVEKAAVRSLKFVQENSK